jgi:predicted SAM-dependent methyltransferase
MRVNSRADRLHLGCGLIAPDGWLNVDGSVQATLARLPWIRRALSSLRLAPPGQASIPWPNNVLRWDLRRRLPFADGRFAAVYSSHLLEHLYRSDALRLLRECRRVLKPGGAIRAVVPDLRSLVDAYVRSCGRGGDPAREFLAALNLRAESDVEGPWAYRLYQGITDFHRHKWMYDERSLVLLLQEAGFSEVGRREFRESRIPGIDQVEEGSRVLDGAGVCVEGVRG